MLNINGRTGQVVGMNRYYSACSPFTSDNKIYFTDLTKS